MKEEKFHLMEPGRLSDGLHQRIHHLLVHICSGIQIQSIDQYSNLERIILQTNDEQVHKLVMSDFIFLGLLKLLIIILFAIHLEHSVYVLGGLQEPFSVVLCYTSLNCVVDDDFLVVCLVVLSVR